MMTITGAQCRAARALTYISRETLSETTGISEDVIMEFERKMTAPGAEAVARIRHGLETLGAIFVPEDAQGGIGVRLKFTRSEAKRIANLENEGGPAGDDDVAH